MNMKRLALDRGGQSPSAPFRFHARRTARRARHDRDPRRRRDAAVPRAVAILRSPRQAAVRARRVARGGQRRAVRPSHGRRRLTASRRRSTSSITVRVPYAIGVVCATTRDLYDGRVHAGRFAHARERRAVRLRVARLERLVHASRKVASRRRPASAATCTGASITPITGGSVLNVSPAMAAGATAGTPAYLYQRVRYSFAASSTAYSGSHGTLAHARRDRRDRGDRSAVRSPRRASSSTSSTRATRRRRRCRRSRTFAASSWCSMDRVRSRASGPPPPRPSTFRTAVFFMNANP